jgi:large subunit ribosomal protein L28
MVALCGKMPCLSKRACVSASLQGKDFQMAKCNHCGKTTSFGHNRSFSQRATNRKFKPNLQKVSVMEKGRLVKMTLCAKCIKTLAKSAA